MKKCLAIASSALLLSLASGSALANNTIGSGPNPFSDCGIGAALFPTIKPLAVTSNVIWDIGTTAVISATASPETCNGKNVSAAQFILDSVEQLAEETARGEGAHLAALLDLLDVAPNARADVIANLRAEMAIQVAQESYSTATKLEKSEQFYNITLASLTQA